jgi:type IV pilus assembly protein PilC
LLRVVLFVFSLAIWSGLIYLIHFLFSLPLRRAERARLFLDLLETGLQRGQSAETMILSAAKSQDRTLGTHFFLLAAQIESGLSFAAALEKVPRSLPPSISAMLQAGEKLGNLQCVLPACRETLRDRPAAVRSAVHYLILFVLFFSPVFLVVLVLVTVFVLPKFKDVFAGMGMPLWSPARFVFGLEDSHILVGLEIIILILMAMVVMVYIGGPQFARLCQIRNFPIADWIAWQIPWKQKRLQRIFSAMLGALLDGGVPEVEAVRLAGNATANEICRHRTARILMALEQGTKLDAAIRIFDDTGEFHWRLRNALHARGGFLKALRGWHETLDAKAFQQEEASAHVITTSVVILNGLLVALIAISMFGMLVMLLTKMAND